MSTVNGTTFLTDVLAAYGVDPNGRTDPSLAATPGSVRAVEKQLAESYFSGNIDPNQGAWLTLRDTVANGVVSVSFAQISETALDGLFDRMEALRDSIGQLSGLTPETDAYRAQQSQIDEREAELSQYLGQNLKARSKSITIDASNGYDQSTTINYVETLRIDASDQTSTDLAVIEISELDFLNAFHFPDSCPICQQNANSNMSDGGGGSVTPNSDSTTFNGGSGSATTTITSNAELTANADTNTIIAGPMWDDSSLSYSIYNRDNPVGYDYPTIRQDVVDAATTTANNMWDFRGDVQNWFAEVAFATGLTFDEIVEDPATGEVGDIRVAFSDDVDGAGAFAFYPSPLNLGGDIWFNDDDPDNFDLSLGTKGAQRGIHELGHALGLSHPHDDGSFNDTSLGDLGFGERDNYRYTVMSYNQGGTGTSYYYDRNMTLDFQVTNFNTSNNFATITYTPDRVMPSTPMILDIEALEHLYGTSTSNAGNTNHDVTTFGSEFIKTIVDAGAGEIDTLDASGTTRSNVINLESGSLSSINIKTQDELITEIEDAIIAAAANQGVTLNRSDAAVQDRIDFFTNTYMANRDANANPTADDGIANNGGTSLYTGVHNLAIARSASIENARGGSADDTIYGNDADNAIQGNGGDDIIDGGLGSDTAVYSGARADYAIYVNTGTTGSPTWTLYDEASPQSGNGEFQVEHLGGGADGTDTITRIEVLEFSDLQLTLATGNSNTTFTSALVAGSPAGQPSTGGSGFVGGGSSGGSGGGSSGSLGTGLVSPHGAEGISSLANVSPESAIDIIDRAIQTISDERAKLGAIVNSLMHHQRWSLQQAESTSAAQSRILDANYAFEAAQLAKAQILQQAGVAMLTQTNMQPRQALNLLQ